MKKLVLALLIPALNGNAGTLNELKNTPASKYDVGKIQLELGSLVLNQKLKGERVQGTNFRFNGFGVEEEPNKLFFKISIVGKAKELTPDVCSTMSKAIYSLMPKDKFMRDLWSGLSEKQYRSLSEQFSFKTEMVSKENSHFKVSC